MSDHNPDTNPNKGFPGDVPLIHGPFTPAEMEAQEERERREANERSDQVFKDRQIAATEAANQLSSRSITVSVITAFIAVLACIGTWYQGRLNKESSETAKRTLEQIKIDAVESANQFQVQLQHFDAGLGRTEILAAHAGEQAVAARDGADAAKSAAEATAREVELSERPWIQVDSPIIPPYDGLLITNNVILTTVTLDIKNIGHSPATSVHAFLELHLSNKANPPIQKVKGICEGVVQKTNTTGFGETVFPDKSAKPTGYPISLPEDEVKEYWSTDPNQRSLSVIGCVAYRSPVSKRFYYTGFNYWVWMPTYPKESTTRVSGTTIKLLDDNLGFLIR